MLDEDHRVFKAEIQMRAAVRIQAYARRARARRALRAERLCKVVTVMQSIYREKQAKRVIHAAHLLDPHPTHMRGPPAPWPAPVAMRWAAAVRCHACWPKLTASHGLPCPAAQTVTALRSSVTAALLIQSRARTRKPKAELRRRQAAAAAEHDRVRSELAEKARSLFAQQQLQQYQTDWVALRSRQDSPPEQATRPRMRPSPPAEDAAVFRRPMEMMQHLAAQRTERPDQASQTFSGVVSPVCVAPPAAACARARQCHCLPATAV